MLCVQSVANITDTNAPSNTAVATVLTKGDDAVGATETFKEIICTTICFSLSCIGQSLVDLGLIFA